MAGPSILHELSKNDLARLLGHVSALRTISELLYQELQRHNLTPDEGEFSDLAADRIEPSLAATAQRYSAFRYVYLDRDHVALESYHSEVSRVLQSRFDS